MPHSPRRTRTADNFPPRVNDHLSSPIRATHNVAPLTRSRVAPMGRLVTTCMLPRQSLKSFAYLRGWVGYFGIQEFKYLFRDLDAWIRSRLRSMQLKKWKKPGKFQRIMIKVGFEPKDAYRVWIKMNRWQSVMRRPVRFVMNLSWFRERGLVFLHDSTLAFSRI